MSITYATSVIDSRLEAVITAVDSGAGGGLIQLGTAAMALVVSTITLNKPCATVSSGVLTFAGTPLAGQATGSGFVTVARLANSDGSVVASDLTVGVAASGSDIIISLQNVTSGSIVTFTSGTITGR